MVAKLPRILASQERRVTTLFHVTEGGAETVIKLSPFAGEFDREVRARELLRRGGLPVEAPNSYQPDGPSTLALPWVAGDALGERHSDAVYERVGGLLARVHDVSAPADFGGNDSWSLWMAGWLSHAMTWWRSARPDECPEPGALESELADLSASMDAACDGAILFDGRPEHFLFGTDSQIGMIDVEELRTGDPAMDIGVLAVWLPRAVPALIAGFTRAGGRIGANFLERVRFYTLLRTLAASEWHHDSLNEVEISRRLLDRLASSEINA